MEKIIPRAEYPRPQLVRNSYQNLNGEWDYATDKECVSTPETYIGGENFNEKIIVPFCRESVLSGIGDTEFCKCVWYKKVITPNENITGKKVILHIGACDYKTDVWVDGEHVGTHIGGYVSFSFDITAKIKNNPFTVVIRAIDDTVSGNQPSGKQALRPNSYGCFYTRTTGIWQTVWLEYVEPTYIENIKYYPDVDNQKMTMIVNVKNGEGETVFVNATYKGKVVGGGKGIVKCGSAKISFELSELHLWEIGNGRLYDVDIHVKDDSVRSYFGMREVGVKDGILYLNGKKVFMRLVLDQGFYPDGIYTAPTYEALKADIDVCMSYGFNGARLHEKVFEPLFLEHADRCGYIVWGEHANWGMSHQGDQLFSNFMQEWMEIVDRDFNHPAIIGWCPLNETPHDTDKRFTEALSTLTRTLDPTRAYIDASGWTHFEGVSDMEDLHDYEQEPKIFKEKMVGLENGVKMNLHAYFKSDDINYPAIPTFVSEYGGTWWAADRVGKDWEDNQQDGWGYGNACKSIDEFYYRFDGLTSAIMECPLMGGLCYTQLTDVEQEQNGLLTYDRRPKFDTEKLRATLTKKAAIEE